MGCVSYLSPQAIQTNYLPALTGLGRGREGIGGPVNYVPVMQFLETSHLLMPEALSTETTNFSFVTIFG